jgi:type II secretory ATPase GspE/PulE/Tfp pilus assembly ATPase PilB-like protein
VRFLQKMLIDAINMRASDLHFEPYEYTYRVRFRVDGELREITQPPSPSRKSWRRGSRSSRAWTSPRSVSRKTAG